MYLAEVIYAKHRDISHLTGDLTTLICSSINEITPDEAVFAQKIRGIWLLYVRTDNGRTTLLKHGKLHLTEYAQLPLYNDNPFDKYNVQNERIVFKDIPVWESDRLIYNYLIDFPNVDPVGAVQFSKSPYSNFMNGDRFIYVRGQFSPPFERNVMLGDYPVRIWHTSQSRSCLRCHLDDHSTNQTDKCAAYRPHQNNVEPFKHPNNVLTNYYPCDIKLDGQVFKSAEHCYLWHKCTDLMEPELAERVFSASTPEEAKRISTELGTQKDLTDWDNKKIDIMRKILLAKLDSCNLYRNVLLKSGDKILVESTKDKFWGSNMSHFLVKTTDPIFYPGENQLGRLHMEIRDNIKEASEHVSHNLSIPPPTTHKSISDKPPAAVPAGAEAPSTSKSSPVKEATTAASKSVDKPPATVSAGTEAPSTSKSSPVKEATTAASKSVDKPPAAVPAGAEAPSTSKSTPVKEATTAASKSVDTISIMSDKMDVSKSVTATTCSSSTRPVTPSVNISPASNMECQSTIKDANPPVLTTEQLTSATAIQLRDNLHMKKPQNPKIDLLKLNDAGNSKICKRQSRTIKKTPARMRTTSLPLSINDAEIRRETHLITGYLTKQVNKQVSKPCSVVKSNVSLDQSDAGSVDGDALSVASSFGPFEGASGLSENGNPLDDDGI